MEISFNIILVCVDYFLYSINEEKITNEDWNDQNKRKELIIDIAILEVNQL